jgi:hypothetical protein
VGVKVSKRSEFALDGSFRPTRLSTLNAERVLIMSYVQYSRLYDICTYSHNMYIPVPIHAKDLFRLVSDYGKFRTMGSFGPREVRDTLGLRSVVSEEARLISRIYYNIVFLRLHSTYRYVL